MRLLLFVLAVLFAGVLVALYAVDNPGYVLIARAPWSVEMPLTLFVPLLLVVFAGIALALYILIRLARIPQDVEHWRAMRHTRRARTALIQGLTHLAEGNWAEAETELLAGLRHGDAPLLNYLGAALAAQGLGNTEKRDEHLAAAHKNAPRGALAVGMTQASLRLQAGQLEQALATLAELRQQAPRHKQGLRLLAQVHEALYDWTGLAELVPDLRDNHVLSPMAIDALELKAHSELLKQSLPSGSLAVLNRAWTAVPRHLRRHPLMLAAYARHLMQQNQMDEAEKVLRDALDESWDDDLIELYGRVPGGDPTDQMESAEGWAASHPENPRLLLALARLAQRARQVAKARTYFERCLALHGSAEAYREFGELLEQAGEMDKALASYRRGLEALAAESRAAPVRGKLGPAPSRLHSAR
ncbi:MAG: heme biosynthesis HemY N-terminal domain-containing protein [Pseudomonadota bacterium]